MLNPFPVRLPANTNDLNAARSTQARIVAGAIFVVDLIVNFVD